jgi:hypothetical protein
MRQLPRQFAQRHEFRLAPVRLADRLVNLLNDPAAIVLVSRTPPGSRTSS